MSSPLSTPNPTPAEWFVSVVENGFEVSVYQCYENPEDYGQIYDSVISLTPSPEDQPGFAGQSGPMPPPAALVTLLQSVPTVPRISPTTPPSPPDPYEIQNHRGHISYARHHVQWKFFTEIQKLHLAHQQRANQTDTLNALFDQKVEEEISSDPKIVALREALAAEEARLADEKEHSRPSFLFLADEETFERTL